MSRIVVVTQLADLEQRLRTAAGSGVQTFGSGALAIDARQLLNQVLDADGVEVVVLGPDVPATEALMLATSFDRHYPSISVVFVAELSPDGLLSAVRAGVRDVVAPNVDLDELVSVIDRASSAALDRRRAMTAAELEPVHRRVIAVVSPKGGSGKTTVATNIAVALALADPLSTVVVDLDVQFGDVATALGVVPEHCLTDAVAGVASEDSMVLKTFLSAHSTGLFALCGSDSPGEGDEVTGAQVTMLLRLLSQQFRYVVVDTAPGLSEQTLAALDCATDAVLLSSMDVPGVRGLRKEIQLLRELNLMPTSAHVVMNFADSRGGLSAADVATTIGTPIDVLVPRSRAVPSSTNQGLPLLQVQSKDPAAAALRQLVRRLSPVVPAIKPVRRWTPRHRAAA